MVKIAVSVALSSRSAGTALTLDGADVRLLFAGAGYE
jgi:hypothetical protein